MTIGARIKTAREHKRLTQEELGALCGTTKQTIFKYETGVVTNIPLDRIERMAAVLDTTPAYIMGWEEPAPPQDDNIVLLNRAAERMTPEQRKQLIAMAKVVFADAFKSE